MTYAKESEPRRVAGGRMFAVRSWSMHHESGRIGTEDLWRRLLSLIPRRPCG
jgi:hypothetical protein